MKLIQSKASQRPPRKVTETALNAREIIDCQERHLRGESLTSLALEYEVDVSTMHRYTSQRTKRLKLVANQVFEAEKAMSTLPVAEQVSVHGLLNDMRIMSNDLGSAGAHSARTAKHMAGLAHAAALKVKGVAGDEASDDQALRRLSKYQDAASKAAALPIDIIAASRGQTLHEPPPPPPEALPRGDAQETLRVYEEFCQGTKS